MVKLALALVLVASCDLPKVRCEYVVPSEPPKPSVSKERQQKLDELADLQLDIDLEIARADKRNIATIRQISQGAHELSANAVRDHAKNASQLIQQAFAAGEEEEKTLDKIARRRCGH